MITYRRHAVFFVSLLVLAGSAAGCTTNDPSPSNDVPTSSIDADQLLEDIRTLSSAEMEGRRMGTEGHQRALEYVVQRFEESGLEPVGDDFILPFRYIPRGDNVEYDGYNVAGMIRGTEDSHHYIVVTAHYDHLGVRDGEIYYGADDNASGTAALFAVADHFNRHPPEHNLLLVALDAEEVGLRGARAFVAEPPIELEQISLNVNMDMVSRNVDDELYAAGTYHYPFLAEYVERAAQRSSIALLMGHDDPSLPPRDDWTMLSDHAAFHEAGIPFIYFGVEDHEDYHQPTDSYENIHPEFYIAAVETIIDFIGEMDAAIDSIEEMNPDADLVDDASAAALLAITSRAWARRRRP